MNKRSVKIHTIITILSFITIGLQFGSYYFLSSLFPAILLSIFLNLILSHFYLEASLSYTSCFLQSLITTIGSSLLILLIYYYQNGSLLIYKHTLLSLILLNWLVPFLYCIIRNFMDRGPRFVNFHSFFVKTSVLFAGYYVFFFIKHYFIFPVSFPETLSSIQNTMIPFLATATYIEDSIYLGLKLPTLLIFIAKSFLLFAPMGFYASILLKEASRIFIFLLTFLLPLAAEMIPLLFQGSFYMDTYLFHLMGCLLGIILYQILNYLSQECLQCDFPDERSRYSFFNFYY